MSNGVPDADLARALALSGDLVAAADCGDLDALTHLDAQRLQLLKSFRSKTRQIVPADRGLLAQISQLNERALGLIEHHRRIKARDLDLAKTGRRAVAAYATTGARG